MVLACCPDPRFRNGAKALQIGLDLLKTDPSRLENKVLVAIASAECGDFISACRYTQEVINGGANSTLKAIAQELLGRFRGEKKYRYRTGRENANGDIHD